MSNETLSTAVSTDKHIPVYLDTKEPIIWLDNNDATIEGTLYEVARYYKRVGLFQTLINHGAVLVGRGVLAVDSPFRPCSLPLA